jgi:hypothetical protein
MTVRSNAGSAPIASIDQDGTHGTSGMAASGIGAAHTGMTSDSSFGQNQGSYTIEVPFMATTTLDSVVSDPGDRAAQNKRKRIREACGFPELKRHSLGSCGSFSLDPTVVLLAFVARSRWNDFDYVKPYCNLFRASELPELVHSHAYINYVSEVVDRIKTECKSLPNGRVRPGLVNFIAQQELYSNAEALEIARKFSSALNDFAETYSEVDRLPGHVVRIDGPEALIVLETPERDVLQKVEASYLEMFGLNQPDSAFIFHRQKWTPDTTVGTYIPAVTQVSSSGIDDEALRSSEKSLPPL